MMVISARVRIRRSAEAKAFSVTPAKAARVSASRVKACTVCTAPSASAARPEDWAIQS